jgi:acyl phosphate:glycerol-3-phosphate acyltransferase
VIYAFLALSYLLGATPTSYWVGKLFHGIDLREHGSGNLGATNAFRVLGWQWAIPVLLVDVAKGFVPVWFFPRLSGASLTWTLGFAAAAILGHMFSLWVGFRGGKGVGTSAGAFLALAPLAVLGAFAVWLALALATRYVSLASLGAAVALPVCVALTSHAGGHGLVWFTVGLAAVVIWAHRGNIVRLMRGQESRFGRSGRRGEESSA